MRQKLVLLAVSSLVLTGLGANFSTTATAAVSVDNAAMNFTNSGTNTATYQRAATSSSPDFTFPTNSPFTIEAMIKPRTVWSDGEANVLDFRDANNNVQTRFVIKSSDNNATGRISIWNPSSGEFPSSGSSTFNFNQWNHIAAVYNGANNVKLYVNGVEKNSGSWQPSQKQDVKLHFGFDTVRFFDGLMNEVRIWRGVARTQSQLAANMSEEIDPDSPGLIAYYRFDDASGNKISDVTGFGNDATTVNSPTWSSSDTSINNRDVPSCSPTQSSVGTEVVQTFTTVGSCKWAVPVNVESVRVLVVGGGGGGGSDNGGGGGAGGYRHENGVTVTGGSHINVIVGAGGSGSTNANAPALNGGRSVFASITARGGGGGGSIDKTAGRDGGSAGGRSGNRFQGQEPATVTSSPEQGNNGGAKTGGDWGGGGGGGGAAAVGGNGGNALGGAGGSGAQNNITGAAVYYAGGGGGGGNNGTAGVGGAGGGGAGSPISTSPATAGTNGLGGGGGGGGGAISSGAGEAGGSGVVIIRYSFSAVTTTVPVATTTTAPSTSNSTTTTVAISTTTVVASAANSSASTGSAPANKSTAVTTNKKTNFPTVTSVAVSQKSVETIAPTTTIVAPAEPLGVSTGSASARIGSKTEEVDIVRAENKLVMSVSTITAEIWVEDSSGNRKDLDQDGNVRVDVGDQISYEVSGLATESEFQLWMFSEPTLLDTSKTNGQGSVNNKVALPGTVEAGSHTLVIQGTNADNAAASLEVGIAVGKINSSGSSTKIIAIVVLVLMALFALILPSVIRRRHDN